MQDRRIRRTQQMLAKALITLTLEKRYEAITIKEITEQADIGYATFFRHYADKDALLHDVLDVVLHELMDFLSPAHNVADPKAVGIALFHYAREHQNVIRVLLRSQGAADLLTHMVSVGVTNTLREYEQRPGSVVPDVIAANHLVTSSITLVQWWIEAGMPYAIEHMADIYAQLIIGPTVALALMPREIR